MLETVSHWGWDVGVKLPDFQNYILRYLKAVFEIHCVFFSRGEVSYILVLEGSGACAEDILKF
jgi:hypothetical protein